jgi:hypothetical protein
MLRTDRTQLIEGVTVFADHEKWDTFYLLPEQPRFRRDENGDPVFQYLKYRTLVEHEDGSKGGAFAIFDVEVYVPEEKQAAIKEKLQEQVNAEAARRGIDEPPAVKLADISFTRGEAKLNIFNDNELLVESKFGAGKPSLFGRHITTWSVELSPQGAELFEEAMQNKGGAVQIVYDWWFTGKLPPLEVKASFNARSFYSFFQEIDVDRDTYGEDDFRETIRERLVESEAMDIDVDPGGITDDAVVQEVSAWARRNLEDAVQRHLANALQPLSAEERELPDGFDDYKRIVSETRIKSFRLTYNQESTAEWNSPALGSLPAITTLKDGDGNEIAWEDYASEVSLDGEFFQTVRMRATVNADFEKHPIHSVEVKANYRGQPMGPQGEVRLQSPNEVAEFEAFREDEDSTYTYSYQINYTGQSRIFQSEPIETDEEIITIGVGDSGILEVEVRPGGGIDFNQISRARVKIRYADPEAGVDPIERQFILESSEDVHQLQEVIFEPVSGPYEYQVRYFLKNGKELETDWREERTSVLYVDDPFAATMEIGLRAGGDLENEIRNIFLDLTYEDTENGYIQENSLVLNADNSFADWIFPVIRERGGTVTYSGTIQFQDGDTEEIPQTTLEGRTLVVPEQEATEQAEISIVPLLLDFDAVRLCRVTVTYDDGESGLHETKDFLFSADNSAEQVWKPEVKDKDNVEYEWKADFFMADGTRHSVGPTQTNEMSIILEMPA